MLKKYKKKLKERKIFSFILLVSILLLSLSLTIAGDYEPEPYQKNPLWKKFMKGLADPLFYFMGNFVNRVLLVYSSFLPQIKDTGEITYGSLRVFLLSNPDLSQPKIAALLSYFISILEPLYVAAIISIGIYLIFLSSSPLGRAKAKSTLLRLILSLILISITPAIIKILFSLSNGLTQAVLSLGPPNLIEIHKSSLLFSLQAIQEVGVANITTITPFLLFSFFLLAGVFLILILRYLLVLFLAASFPLAIFLFSFKPTKTIGRILISQLLFWLFLPVSFAIALVSIALGENLFHEVMAELWNFALAGTLALILSPFGMYYAAKYGGKALAKLSKKISKRVEERFIPELKELEEKISEREIEIELKEISKEGKISEKELKQNKKLYYQLKKEAKSEEETLGELLRRKYNYKLISEEETLKRRVIRKRRRKYRKGYLPSVPIPQIPSPKPKEIRPEKPKKEEKKGLVIRLGLRTKPKETSQEIEKGKDKKVEVKVENLTDEVLHEVELMDQDFVENDILVSYSENNFSLSPGETKTIQVKITVMETTKIKTYEGIITVKCKEGFKNFIEVKVKVKPKEKEKKEKEEEPEKKKEKIEETRIRPIKKPKMPEEKPELPPKASLVSLANLEGEINLQELQKEENALLYKKLSQAAEKEGKTVEEFIQDKYNLRVVKKRDPKEICADLSELANIDGEINLEQLRLREDLYKEISERAEEEDKSVKEYVKEHCGFEILEEKRKEEAEPRGAPILRRKPPYKPEKEKPKEEEEEEEEKLAPPAPEVPPKIIPPS